MCWLQGDGEKLELAVQLVKRTPPARTYYLVVHPYAPQCGRGDFREFLREANWQATVVGVPACCIPWTSVCAA